MLINDKMPTTIVGILTFISMIHTTFENLKARKVFIFQHFSFYEKLKFHAQSMKKSFITSGYGSEIHALSLEPLCYYCNILIFVIYVYVQ